MSIVLEIRDLVKRYGSFTAVDSLSLTIPSQVIFGLLGPNGAGKTTTIKLLMGMLQPTSGSIRVAGLDAFADSVAVKAKIGYLPDEPSFYRFMRGREIIRFAGEMQGLKRQTIQERGNALAERLQLTAALDEFAENYSRGMKKKLGLICALLHEPELLVLDEPTNGLDPYGAHVLHALMREWVSAGRSVIFSTHLLDQAEKLCHRVAVVNAGRIAAEGSIQELRDRFGADASLESLFFQLTQHGQAEEAHAAELITTSGS